MEIHFFIITFDENHEDYDQLALNMNEYSKSKQHNHSPIFICFAVETT